MKLSKTALLVLGIGIFILGFAFLFVLYSGQSGEQEQLTGSLANQLSVGRGEGACGFFRHIPLGRIRKRNA